MNQSCEILHNRAIITLSGPERINLLQNVITNNVAKLENGVGIYSALLSPQGKFLHDFFLFESEEIIYLDCDKEQMPDLFRRLLMYRLRSNVEILDESKNYFVIVSKHNLSDCLLSFQDPRNTEMGYRAIVKKTAIEEISSEKKWYEKTRISLGIPEGPKDFIVNKSTILEGNYEQLNGVDFEKGCYVGQEVTARMKYRGKIKKLIFPANITGEILDDEKDVTDKDGKKVGELRSHTDTIALVLFRVNELDFNQHYYCGQVTVKPYKPHWVELSENDR